MKDALGAGVDDAHRHEFGCDGSSAREGIDRRRFVKGAVAGIGIAAAGVVVKGQAAAEPAVAASSGLDGRLRAITWTGSNSAVGLIGVGAEEVKVRPMALQGEQLSFSGSDIATLTVGPGPVAIGPVPGSKGTLLVTRTTLETVGQYTVSFDLDQDLRRFFLAEGIGFDGYKTSGQTTFDILQAVPEPIVIDSRGEMRELSWKDALAKAHYEPISVHTLNGKLFVFLVSSGSNKLEVSILGDIVGLELSASDASISALHSIGKLDGHARRGMEVIELGSTRVGFLSSDDSGRIQVIGYDVATKEMKYTQFSAADLPNSKRILHHDRTTAGGRLRSWVAEVMPGTYTLETTEKEVLWPA